MNKANLIKRQYPEGTRIELIEMDDPYSKLNSGEKGTVMFVDAIGTIHVKWDCGSTLGVIPGVDSYRKI